ncbi:response regulator [Flavobacterium sp. 17A]|uniref:Response regulator n=1 Tax=Flavobacterium potami TaxID=2872310 RepID=A0A9X1H8Z7_9FLAO|nr:response regulator [Flavobacterium potami]MBZ4034258.1 response regulator [Flavobacterium potami]
MLQQQNSITSIYLAEDDEDDSTLFLEVFSEIHPEIAVNVSEDGQQLLDHLHETMWDKPQIIFLDINMPLKNGFECLKEIRSSSCFDSIKIVMFSTSSSKLHIELCYKLGADLYAVKPGPFQEVREIIKDIMTVDWGKTERNRSEFLLSANKMSIV